MCLIVANGSTFSARTCANSSLEQVFLRCMKESNTVE